VSRDDYYIFEERSFLKYADAEKQNPGLKKFLDLNRFSAAIKYKLVDDTIQFKKYANQIDPRNLSAKKKMLLLFPAVVLKKLIAFKQFLFNNGLGKSVFR
jgi:hypothetical protein